MIINSGRLNLTKSNKFQTVFMYASSAVLSAIWALGVGKLLTWII